MSCVFDFGGSGEGLVGWGTVATFRSRGDDRFAQAQHWWRGVTAEAIVRDDVDEPGTGPINEALVGAGYRVLVPVTLPGLDLDWRPLGT